MFYYYFKVTKPRQDRLESAGYVEPDGIVGRVVGSGRLCVPKWAALDRGYLHWKGEWRARVEPSPVILDRFIELWSVDDDAILTFAKTYGTLRRPVFLFREFEKTDFEAREPLSRWRSLSEHSWGLLHVASKLGSDEEINFEEWSKWTDRERMLSGIGPSLALGTGEGPDGLQLAIQAHGGWKKHARRYLGAEIAAWNMKLGPISFGIEHDDGTRSGWKTVLDFGGSLPCYIGLQLMLVIARGDVYTCSACGNPYIRQRGRGAPAGMRKAPRPGQRNYCQSEECKSECNRFAVEQKRKRDRLKGEQQ